MQLGRAAGDIERRDRTRAEHGERRAQRRIAHRLAALGAGIDVAVRAGLVADLADIELQDLDAAGDERLRAGVPDVLVEAPAERIDQRDALQVPALLGRRGQRRAAPQQRRLQRDHGQARRGGAVGVHIPISAALLRICTPWTMEAPPRIAAATCTASVNCSTSQPFESASCV